MPWAFHRTNAKLRPSGESAGLVSQFPPGHVNRCRSAPSSADNRTSPVSGTPPSSLAVINSRLLAAQVKVLPNGPPPSNVHATRRAGPPLAGSTYSPAAPFGAPGSALPQWTKAIHAPSGDQARWHSAAESEVSRRGGSDPGDFT